MAKTKRFKYALKRFRRDLEEVINEKALTLGEEISKKTAFTVQSLARERLLNFNNASSEAQHLIQMVSDNIVVEDDAYRAITTTHTDLKRVDRITGKGKIKKVGSYSGYVVKVNMDSQGLAMFLEFGTGLEGKKDEHPEAEKFKWKYAIRDGHRKYKSNGRAWRYFNVAKNKGVKWYPTLFDKTGFIFRKLADSYIDNNDIQFKKETRGIKHSSITEVPPKIGKVSKTGKVFNVSGYKRYKRVPDNNSTYVISSGIKPIRYVYEAKTAVRRVFRTSKTAQQVIDGLNSL